MSVFVEISLIIFIATGLSLLMRLLRQPIVVGYILAGVLSGPIVLNLIHSEETLELFSKIGITILLFIIGLHLNPKVIREVGGVSLVTGLGQILFTTLAGLGLTYLLGFNWVQSIFIAIAMTFSSTIIVLKLLSDKGDLDSLYGKVSVGFLLVQDIVASMILLGVSVAAKTGESSLLLSVGSAMLQIVGLAFVIMMMSMYVLPRLIKFAAGSQETLFIFCIAWGMGVASVFQLLGLSVEIGALMAGVALSTTAYASEIASRLKPLRDFFVVVFFILLGSQMVVDNFVETVVPAIVLSLFVLVGNPLIVFLLMNLLGYHKRVAFMSGLTVAQISEFSMILVALGKEVGYLGDEVISLITLIGLGTIALSSYMILYADGLYRLVSPLLEILQIRKDLKNRKMKSKEYEVILFGYGRVGQDYVKKFKKMKKSFLVVDFDPLAVDKLGNDELDFEYGDAKDVEFLEELPLRKAKLIVSVISDFEVDLLLVKTIRKVNEKAVVIVKTSNLDQAEDLYQEGASYVVMPHYLGAKYALRMIGRNGLRLSAYEKSKRLHLAYLEKRRE